MPRVRFHSFTLSDVEDPEVYAAGSILEWRNSEMGQWAVEYATDLTYDITNDVNIMGYRVSVTGLISEDNYLEFVLRWR